MGWTAGQRAAIEAKNPTVLVSAAAGSGKTAVLIERVMSLLKSGYSLDRMLIVTFTRAAAAEMRERLTARLDIEGENDAHLRLQAMRVERAMICTLHVFCYRVIRDYFQASGIDPLSRIGDEAQLSPLRRRALDEVLESAYAAPDADEARLIDGFDEVEDIEKMIADTHTFLMAQASPEDWARAQEEEKDVHVYLDALYGECLLSLEAARQMLGECERALALPGAPMRYEKTLLSDRTLMKQLLIAAGEQTLTGGKLSFMALSKGKREENEDDAVVKRFKDAREAWKDKVREAFAWLPEDIQDAERLTREALPPLRALLRLTLKYNERFFELKQAKNLLDYNDLEHLTIKALRDSDVRRQISGGFDAVFVDEYQDVSGIQEAIVQAVRGPSLFLVGDVKQSIYRFRLADPTLFLRKYEEFSTDESATERKILLGENFRSDENILRCVNQVFRHAMRKRVTEIAYDDDASLKPGIPGTGGAPTEIHVIWSPADEDGDEIGETPRGYRHEAALLAKRIRQFVMTETIVENGQSRAVRYRDIAILLRNASSRAPFIARTLQREGIPVYSDADAQYYEQSEIADILNLLRVIDNPYQDIPLLGALRCPCFDLTEEELARARLVDRAPGTPFYEAFYQIAGREGALGAKARRALQTLDTWRFAARSLTVETLIRRLMEESGLYMRAGASDDGELRRANLRLLAERAGGESAESGLSSFLKTLDIRISADDTRSAKTLGENENVVRILTIHKSKGLQFPVVFLCELSRAFKLSDGKQALFLHPEMGAAMKWIDGRRRVRMSTVATDAITARKQMEQRAEEARLLYVGMTRAKHRLVLLASPRNLVTAQRRWSRPAREWAAGGAESMLTWIMQSMDRPFDGTGDEDWTADDGAAWSLRYTRAESLERPVDMVKAPDLSVKGSVDERTRARLSRALTPRPPLKTSVTAIAKRLRTEEDEVETPEDKRRPLEADAPAKEEAERPPFMRGGTAAVERGIVTHKALGLVDYDLIRRGRYAEAADALLARGILLKEERAALRLDWMEQFFMSPLGQRLLRAADIRREWAFNLRRDDGTLLQGVIDLCFIENGQWVLVDYKTDRLSARELVPRYQSQILWYARALEAITHLKVRDRYLFALRAGEAAAVEANAQMTDVP